MSRDPAVSTLEWVTERAADVPDELLAVIRATLEAVPEAGTVTQTLTAAAMTCLERSLAAGSERTAAAPLLAGDALLTFAAESAVEDGALDNLVSLTASRLLAMVEPA